MNYVKISNAVSNDVLKEIQLGVLEDASNAVMCTAGPYGSTTMILKNGGFPTYSKDGKKVLDSIKYAGAIETAILDEISQLASYVVKEVGDGTTTAIRLSYHILYRLLSEMKNEKVPSRTIINAFNEVVDELKTRIKKHGRDITLNDIYKICMISTNGNEEISTNISNIYAKYGFNAFIDIDTTSSADSFVKDYDGITLNKGYASNAYINTEEGKSIIHNPKIYYFRDPIDTEETLSWLTNIIYSNIIIPVSKNDPKIPPIPTVIITPNISRDAEALLAEIEKMMYGITPAGRPELLIITKLNRYMDDVEDITKLCGCPAIMKYIDPTVQKKDQELGKAPTIKTILDFCGHAERIEADSIITKFINPDKMYEKGKVDENGRPIFTSVYTGLVNNIESDLKQLQESEDDKVGISMLKRRLHSLTSTLVQYYIGGIAVSDRDACKDLAEDAVLNCRSAIVNGVGFGMCYESFRSCLEYQEDMREDKNKKGSTDNIKTKMLSIITGSIKDYIIELYQTVNIDEQSVEDSITAGCPLNLRTLQFDHSVLSSINTDIVILEAISKIITNMYTSNQALVTDPLNNMYMK